MKKWLPYIRIWSGVTPDFLNHFNGQKLNARKKLLKYMYEAHITFDANPGDKDFLS